MSKRIALLRGINVGGTGKLPMADLRALMADLGATNIETYIQSGNVVFEGSLNADELSEAIETRFGFAPRVLILEGDAFAKIVNGWPLETGEPKEMHIFFCSEQPNVDPQTLIDHTNDVEQFQIGDRAVYLFSPGGLSQSKLADKLERRLGIPATARNWNTLQKLLSML